jgi:hypothetical protein
MEQIKEAFNKVKKDIFLLQEEICFIKEDIESLKEIIEDLISFSKQMIPKKEEEQKKDIPTQNEKIQTEDKNIPTDNSIFNHLKHQNKAISIGNEGVPTDKQTNQQTNQQTDFSLEIDKKPLNQQTTSKNESLERKDSFKEAISMLESLDNIKKELRLKFKKLTDQELLVFSTLYQLEEEHGYTDYKSISLKLNLTESSIRDYVGKLIKKGIPVDKVKINNKSVHLGISSSLKKIATLPTILLLRDM